MAKKRKIKQIVLRKKRYSIKKVPYLGKYDGDCDNPADPNRTIRIRSGLKDEQELEVLLHEMLHACFWDISEESIEESGIDIARVLWQLGYRKD